MYFRRTRVLSYEEVGWMAVRLTAIPGASEAVVAGAFATVIFGMHLTLGLSLGFILGAVSPAVVVLGMFDLQSRGYGVFKVRRVRERLSGHV